jgi:hypothetical protein
MISVKRDSEMSISRVKDSGFKRYVDQMQDPVEGPVTSGPRDFAENGEAINQVLTGDQRSLCALSVHSRIGDRIQIAGWSPGGR